MGATMSKHGLSCWGCNHPISEGRDTVFWDDSIPPKPLCKECFENVQQEGNDES